MKRRVIYAVLMAVVAAGIFFIEEQLQERQNHATGKGAASDTSDSDITNDYFMPASTTGQIIHHNYYSLSYNEKYEQAEWVAWELKKEHLSTAERKRPFFNEDPLVKTRSSDWRSYRNSGYDKGHLCPAGDRRFSAHAYNQTFLTSNITPQDHEFNSGIWNDLEQRTRYWARKHDGVFVVTGGVLKDGLKSIGKDRVGVPEQFFKIILDHNNGRTRVIAFLIPHKDSSKDLKEFVVKVDSLEKLTGIDFFPKLEDSTENRLESTIETDFWF